MIMKNKQSIIAFNIIISIMIFIIGCSPTSKTEKDQIIPAKIIVWDEIDSEIIADSLISISLQSDWNKNFSKKRKPIIVVGKIVSTSDEIIDVSLLAKDIERSLINSGKVTFIADKQKREDIRNDRKNKDDFTDEKKFIKYLKSLKSDFFISGNFNSIVDSTSIPVEKRYTLNAEIISTKNASVVWKGTQDIVK